MDLVLSNVRRMMKIHPRPNHRTTIEHAGFFTESQAQEISVEF